MIKITNKLQQKGMVSILVTMFMMIVITLIVVSFAKLMRREQRQVLDRQLSTQAFYAAESGVNDAVPILKANPTVAKQDCSNTTAPYLLTPTLDAAAGVAYTCVLVNPNLTDLQYDGIEKDNSTVIPIKASGAIGTLSISWEAKDSTGVFSGCPAANNFPADSSWPATCNAGVLRIDLVPMPPPGGITRDNLMNNTLTSFLYPSSGGSTLSYPANIGANSGAITPIKCAVAVGAPACKVDITNLTSSNYYLRVRSIYKVNKLTINAGGLTLSGAQAQVDVTGKAGDVLRRISVRVDTGNITGYPDFAIQSGGDICKKFTVGSGIAPDWTAGGSAACSLAP